MEKIEHSILGLEAKVVFEAALLKSSDLEIPVLTKYFPQNLSEYEIQKFNITGSVPIRLKSAEEIAMWLLEKQQLSRENVTHFLTDGSFSSRNQGVMSKIASKICSLEAAAGFAEGLKFFIPVVGIWDPSLDFPIRETPMLNEALTVYVQNHLLHSTEPIFETSSENIPTLVELAICLLDLSCIVYQGRKPQALAMSDFFSMVRAILRQSRTGLTLSVKRMTDLFVAVSTGRPLAALKIPADTPSYLFAASRYEGHVAVGTDAADISSFQSAFAKLYDDALYLFEPVSTSINSKSINKHGKLLMCIPLGKANLYRGDSLVLSSLLLELVHINSRRLSMIHFEHSLQASLLQPDSTATTSTPVDTGARGDATGGSLQTNCSHVDVEVCMPVKVTYHKSLYLDVLMSSTESDAFFVGEDEGCGTAQPLESFASRVDAWSDAIEGAMWESRHGKQ